MKQGATNKQANTWFMRLYTDGSKIYVAVHVVNFGIAVSNKILTALYGFPVPQSKVYMSSRFFSFRSVDTNISLGVNALLHTNIESYFTLSLLASKLGDLTALAATNLELTESGSMSVIPPVKWGQGTLSGRSVSHNGHAFEPFLSPVWSFCQASAVSMGWYERCILCRTWRRC